MVAHELAHIKNHDTLIMTITATIAGAISMLAQFGMFFGGNRDNNSGGGMGIIGTLAMVILAPIAAMLVQMAISRTREYSADKLGAQICGQPIWLASALAKIAECRARRSRTSAPSAIRAWRTCSSSTRCRASGWTTCSRPIRRPRTGSRRWSKLAREMGQGSGGFGGGGGGGGGGGYAGAAPRVARQRAGVRPVVRRSPWRSASRRSLGAIGFRRSTSSPPPASEASGGEGADEPRLLTKTLDRSTR